MNFEITKKNISYFLLFIFLIIYFFLFFIDVKLPVLKFILYGILFLVFLLFFRDKKLIRNYHKDLMQTVIIIVASYFILYYLSGLIVGYVYNIYNTSFTGILYNTVIFILPLFFREEVRLKFVYLGKSKVAYIFVTIVFILCELFSSTFFDFQTNAEFFTQFVSIFLPIVLENILLTYLAYIGIRSTVYAYFIPMLISRYFVPVVVDFDWFYSLLFQLLLSILLYYYLMNEYLWKAKKIYSRKTGKKNSFLYVCICCIILSFGLFVAGVFKYQPVAVLTYSMEPVFTRGDAVVVEKLSTNSEKRKLKKGDIIQYQYDKTVVVHRILKKYQEQGETIFILKGDNNDSEDLKPVKMDQIIGKVIFSVPKVGYPSVWLSEFLYPEKEAEVEVGR